MDKQFIVCNMAREPLCDLNDSVNQPRNIKMALSVNEITTLSFAYPVIPEGKWLNLVNQNLIFFEDEYFIIRQTQFSHNQDGSLTVNVECKHYSDTLATQVISVEEVEPMNVVSLMKVALCYDGNNPTLGWTVGNVEVDKVALRGLEAFEQSPFSILLNVAEKYDGILKFNSKTMTVDMLERKPTERPILDLRVSKNLKSFNISYDTTEMYTRLYCYGETDENGVQLDITSVNPTEKGYIENFDYYKALGYTDEFIQARPDLFVQTNIWKDDSYFDAQDLYDAGLKQLKECSTPKVDVKIQALDTKAMNLSGEITKLELGSCIEIFDEDIDAHVLCNVIKRSIDYDNPHLLTCEVTNAVTYQDTLSKLFINVKTASNVVTSGGNLIGGSGASMGDVKNYLNLYYLNAEQIEAKYATIGDLEAYYVTSEYLQTHYLDAENIGANYATIGSLNAVQAVINKLDADKINANIAEFDQLFGDGGTFYKLVATKAEFDELEAGNATIAGLLKATNAEIDTIKANYVEVADFTAYQATINSLLATYATIENLEANYLKASQAEITYAKISELNALKGSFDTLEADLATVNTLIANKADVEDLEAVNATIDTLNADLANVNTLLANKVDANYVQAELAKINKVITDDLEAIHAIVDVLDTKYATITQLNTAVANINTLIADKADIADLNVAVADIGDLSALVANINSILAGNIGTGLLQTIHLTANNVVIDDAVIKSANIEGLDVSKLNAGTISTDKFVIKSDDGGVVISGSTQQFKDGSGKVRLQIGKDAQGNFNFIVFGEDGTTAIYNQNGITQQAVPDGLIVDKMVADNANIQASKIQYTDKDGNKTLQTYLNVVQGKIDALIKDTTIDGTSLKDKYTQLSATVDGINTTVANVQTSINDITGDITDISSEITSIKTTAQGIQTQVTKAQADATSASTLAQQMADKFSWIVKSGTSSSNFELTDRTATLVANAINLNGLVTFNGLATDAKDKINSSAKTVSTEYALGTSATTAPTIGWSTATPTWTAGKYIWQRTVTTLQNGNSSTSSPVCIQGAKGETGATGGTGPAGKGISSYSNTYQAGTSATTAPTGTWSATIPTVSAGQYLWTKTVLTFTDNSTSTSYSVARQGVNGTNGTNGATGRGVSSIVTEFYLSTSKTSQAGGSWVTTPPTWTTGKYLWTRNKITYTSGTPATEYTTPQCDSSWEAVNDIKVGGRNLLLRSEVSDHNRRLWTLGAGTTLSYVDDAGKFPYYKVNIASDATTGGGISGNDGAKIGSSIYLMPNTKYVWHFLCFPDVNVALNSSSVGYIQCINADSSNVHCEKNMVYTPSTIPAGKWTLCKVEFEVSQYAKFVPYLWYLAGSHAGKAIRFADLKLEEGNTPTTWTLAPEDVADQALIDTWTSDAITQGVTTINGGYIKTQTIKTDQLVVDEIFASGSAAAAKIKTYELNADMITSGTIKSNFLEVYGLSVKRKGTNIETLGVSNDGEVTVRGTLESYDYHTGKTGWSIRADGDMEVNNLTARGNIINNQAGIASGGGSGRNLMRKDWIVAHSNGTATIDKSKYLIDGSFTVSQNAEIDRGFYIDKISAMTVGKQYIVHFKFKCTSGSMQQVYIHDGLVSQDTSIYINGTRVGSVGEIKTISVTNGVWYDLKFTYTAKTYTGTYLGHIIQFNKSLSTACSFEIKDFKWEEGNVATPWGPAPEDNVKQVAFWAGSSYEERESAPFVVYNDGSIKATKGEYSGLWTGNIKIGNIEIKDPSSQSSNDAIITISNGGTNGVDTNKIVQLRDSQTSSFAQNIEITTLAGSPTISLNQDGSGRFTKNITIGTNTANSSLDGESLTIKGFELGVIANKGYVFKSGSVDVGTASNASDLTVYGKATVKNSLNLTNILRFGSVVEATIVSTGVDFDFIQ